VAIEVIWFEDRFSIKGQYLSVWLHTLKKSGVEPIRVARVNLHHTIHGQLLTKYKTRKAPTWRPERADEILKVMRATIDKYRETLKAVVLASPESLVATGLDPEFATLGKLRGSVYEFAGVPAIVTLPMSAWFTQVSQKDIAVANFGLESETEMQSYAQARSINHGGGRLDSLVIGKGTAVADSADSDSGSGDEDRLDQLADDGVSASGNGDLDADSGGDADSERDDDDDGLSDDDEDNFYYVPVMTPVGKVMITFDMQKLSRYVNDRVGDFWLP
jgi:hypothetical protein